MTIDEIQAHPYYYNDHIFNEGTNQERYRVFNMRRENSDGSWEKGSIEFPLTYVGNLDELGFLFFTTTPDEPRQFKKKLADTPTWFQDLHRMIQFEYKRKWRLRSLVDDGLK